MGRAPARQAGCRGFDSRPPRRCLASGRWYGAAIPLRVGIEVSWVTASVVSGGLQNRYVQVRILGGLLWP